MELPIDNDGVSLATGDCCRDDKWVAEIGMIVYHRDSDTYRVSYGIMNTIVRGVCSLEDFLTRFPYRVELRPKADLSNQKRSAL